MREGRRTVGALLATRLSSFRRESRIRPDEEESESSAEPEGVSGGDGGKVGDVLIVTWRMSPTEIVPLAAISRARLQDFGTVLNTT